MKWRQNYCGVRGHPETGLLLNLRLKTFQESDKTIALPEQNPVKALPLLPQAQTIIILQDILRCTNLGSPTEKRPREVGYMLIVAGNSNITQCVCIVYIVCSLCTFFSLVSAMFSLLSYMTRPLEGVLMARYSHSKP